MIKKVLAGAAFATAAMMAVAAPASAHTNGPEAENSTTNAHDSIRAARAGSGPTTSGSGATDFGTRNGNTAIAGDSGGILNTYGAPLINIDGRCLVPLPEGEGIGGHLLGGPKAACNVAPVDQFQAPQKLL
ncbi:MULTISPECIES: hypothetical protein [unclassified Streptomyces]|uniref:hypothetical protein n=1 Tax=unclassified Streptomyces TaxID=2593676 RepID=UPI0006AEFF42|nr:hypothetical protein [Streptomyces sp. WM6378]